MTVLIIWLAICGFFAVAGLVSWLAAREEARDEEAK